MQNDDKVWVLHYTLNRDLRSVNIVQLLACPEFCETGKYSVQECEEIIKIIRSTPLPRFEKKYWWGGKTLEEWDEFVEVIKNKIEGYGRQ